MASNYFSTKAYQDYPCCHRQWRHDGHCSFLHGYSRSFSFTFFCKELNDNNFVMDFSKLRTLKEHLDYMYDHTSLISEDDPELDLFQQLHDKKMIDMRIVKNGSMEATAKYLFEYTNQLVKKLTNNRVSCYKVEVRENQKNSAIYSPYENKLL